ncbi:hypothetical protein CEXT_724561 [Caerostris extrusa]|uniref:Uncharacterized protein n=1 Tax=Caerostris extrusa TaxID=172846 RepID=A0AAV4Y495_CAEEX|nr:hypothetical protein CEXT_724561 [Caerostris extrusa]
MKKGRRNSDETKRISSIDGGVIDPESLRRQTSTGKQSAISLEKKELFVDPFKDWNFKRQFENNRGRESPHPSKKPTTTIDFNFLKGFPTISFALPAPGIKENFIFLLLPQKESWKRAPHPSKNPAATIDFNVFKGFLPSLNLPAKVWKKTLFSVTPPKGIVEESPSPLKETPSLQLISISLRVSFLPSLSRFLLQVSRPEIHF